MNPVVHFEMPYDNRERVAKFYASVFGWQMQVMGAEMGNYILAITAESGPLGPKEPGAINGGFFEKKPEYPMQYPSVVVSVPNIQQALTKVVSAGGVVFGDPMDIPGVGRYISFADSEGNRVGMLQPAYRATPKPAAKKKKVTAVVKKAKAARPRARPANKRK